VVPLEGCPISLFTAEQKEQVYDILKAFNAYLPPGPMDHCIRRWRRYEDQTYFAWIGRFGLGDPYYFRISSPATFCEVRRQHESPTDVQFDFHCGSECTEALDVLF
jgi:hypothetical protein